MQSEDSQKIVSRFFEALHTLIASKAIRGKQTFTREYGINRWNLNTLESDHSRDIFQPCWLTYLVRDFGISATWLLTGTGGMFATAPTKKGALSLKTKSASKETARVD